MWMRFSHTAPAFSNPLLSREVGARQNAAAHRLSRRPLNGAPKNLSFRSAGRGFPCRDKHGGAAAHNRCRAQASAVARAAARDSGADEGFRQRCRGLAPSGPVPVQEQRRFGRRPQQRRPQRSGLGTAAAGVLREEDLPVGLRRHHPGDRHPRHQERLGPVLPLGQGGAWTP